MVRALKRSASLSSHWYAIRDQEVRRAELEAAIELRRLEEERGLLTTRQREVEAELSRLGEPEANLRAHRTLARWWGGLFLLALGVAVLSAWWSVNWYLSLTWEKALLAGTLFVLPLIGWVAFLMYARDRAQGRDLWRIVCGLGLLVVLSSVAAGALLGAGRMAGTALEEEQRQTASAHSDGNLAADADSATAPSADRVQRVKRLLALFTMVAVVLLGVAGEVAAGLSFHEYLKRMTVVWTVWPFYREQAQLGEALAENAHRQEEVRRWPELLYTRLTAEGLRAEAEASRREGDAELRANSLPRLVRLVFLAVGLGLALLLIAAGLAFAGANSQDTTVVLLDLSVSSQAHQEFAQNLRAVEAVISRVPAGGSRIAILGVTEASFGAIPILAGSSPRTSDRFGEYLEGWRRRMIRDWRQSSASLKPAAQGTDLFGALARTALEFDGPAGAKRLIVFSDMRQVGRGVSFERPLGDPRQLVGQVASHGLVPKLEGVRVWVLGAHTAEIDERQWERVRTFWTEYFRQAGAELVAYTPNRRLADAQ